MSCSVVIRMYPVSLNFFFQAEDGIRDLVRSRGLGDVYKRQQESRIGNQSGGRVFLFLHTDSFQRDYDRLVALDLSLIHI